MGVPQYLYLALWLIGAGAGMVRHGTPKEGKNDFWADLITSLLIMGILYWGGFFG